MVICKYPPKKKKKAKEYLLVIQEFSLPFLKIKSPILKFLKNNGTTPHLKASIFVHSELSNNDPGGKKSCKL